MHDRLNRLADESKKKKNTNAWIVDWDRGALSAEKVAQRATTLIGDTCEKSLKESVAGVLEYVSVIERVYDSKVNSKNSTAPPVDFPHFGPLFHPPALDELELRGCTAPVKNQGWSAIRTAYGTRKNIKVIAEQYSCADHKIFIPTSPAFWKDRQPWVMGELPHFFKEAVVTRDLFDAVVELRPKSNRCFG
ncbi:hypothetical protein IAR50_002156 [Cryptococcus sp. DSM 104548]